MPVEWIRGEDRSCLADAANPQVTTAQLTVTCHDAGRIARAALTVSYGAATRAERLSSFDPKALFPFELNGLTPLTPIVGFVFPSGEPLHPFWASGRARLEPLGPAVGALFATDGSRNVESVGCWPPYPYAGCNDAGVTFPSGTVTGVAASTLVVWPAGTSQVGGLVTQVAGDALDLAFLPNGDLVVLSQWFSPSTGWVTLVSAVPASLDAQTIAAFPSAYPLTRFSKTPEGRLAFVTLDYADVADAHPTLRSTDGVSVDGVPVALPATPSWGCLTLSADASNWAVACGQPYIGSPEASWTPLDAMAPTGNMGVVWLSDGVAVWRDYDPGITQGGEVVPARVQVFDATPPHSRRFVHDVRPMSGYAGGAQHLLDVLAVGDHLVLTTNTGIRILGPDGSVVGGSDPLPCALTTTSMAARVGPNTVAVGAGQYLYAFELQ